MMAEHAAPRPSLPTRLWRATTSVLLAAITAAGLLYLLPAALGYERYVITGGSMAGSYDTGSIAFEEQVPVAELAVGDVITYLPPADSMVTTLVTHRIHEISYAEDGAREFRTKGDANPDVDPWTFRLTADTQPVARFAVPHLGWALIALADREIRMLVIGLPASLVALASLVELVRTVARERRPRLAAGNTPATTPTS
jgi:signal peptidase I